MKGGSKSTSDKGVDKSEERENIVSVDVLDEKDIIANRNHDLEDGVEKNVVIADVSDEKDLIANGNHDWEDRVEKNKITVDVEGVSGTIDSKESAIEDAENNSEKAHVEPVSDIGANVQNSLAELASSQCTKDNGIPVEGKPDSKSERPEEESRSKLVSEADNSTTLNTTDMTEKVSCKDCGQEVRAAITAERAARDLLKSKRQEMHSVQSEMNKLNNVISVGDIDDKVWFQFSFGDISLDLILLPV
ncbi:hypothetical protein RJT34_13289 [Clitoria ternatea]|uniref:Uncharacterized protein n=1 Tax=Clitoria ternatea TaxID=43366 RepID=A0AAN9JQN8_CLITE